MFTITYISKMKNLKKFILPLLIFFFIFSPTIALAQMQATAPGVRETVREEAQERIVTAQAFLSQRKQEIIRSHFNHVTRRLEAAVNRLYLLINRIESRVAKIEAVDESLDTELIKADIASAKEKLDQATIQLGNVKTKMEEVIDSETPKEDFVEVREMVSEIRENLIGVHQILVKVIGDIKGLRVGE